MAMRDWKLRFVLIADDTAGRPVQVATFADPNLVSDLSRYSADFLEGCSRRDPARKLLLDSQTRLLRAIATAVDPVPATGTY